jgi:hypothetical protein
MKKIALAVVGEGSTPGEVVLGLLRIVMYRLTVHMFENCVGTR